MISRKINGIITEKRCLGENCYNILLEITITKSYLDNDADWLEVDVLGTTNVETFNAFIERFDTCVPEIFPSDVDFPKSSECHPLSVRYLLRMEDVIDRIFQKNKN